MNGTVLVIGDHQQTIAVVRSLARAGRRVVVGQHARRPFASVSRYARGTWQHPDPKHAAAFGAALARLVAEHPDIRCVFPVGEGEIRALLEPECRDLLPPHVNVVTPSPEATRTCLDKRRTIALALELGIPQVPTAIVSTHRELLSAAEAIGLPVAVKCPDSSRLVNARKAITCRSDRELAALHGARFPLIVQRWFAGVRHNCQFAAADGHVTAYFEQAVLRTDAPDGTGFGIEGVSVAPSDELRHHCAALVARLGYTGVGCAQFLVDEASGDCTFLELNPRLDATCELALRCGVDLPRLALDPVAGGPASYPVGRRFHWLLGDLRSIGHRVKASHLSRRKLYACVRRMAAAHWRAHHQLTWHWTDPMPTLYLYGHALVIGGRSYFHAANVAARSH